MWKTEAGIQTAQHVTEKENKTYEWNYNHEIRFTQLGMGDMILLKRTTFKGKHKIQDYWEDAIYHVEG